MPDEKVVRLNFEIATLKYDDVMMRQCEHDFDSGVLHECQDYYEWEDTECDESWQRWRKEEMLTRLENGMIFYWPCYAKISQDDEGKYYTTWRECKDWAGDVRCTFELWNEMKETHSMTLAQNLTGDLFECKGLDRGERKENPDLPEFKDIFVYDKDEITAICKAYQRYHMYGFGKREGGN